MIINKINDILVFDLKEFTNINYGLDNIKYENLKDHLSNFVFNLSEVPFTKFVIKNFYEVPHKILYNLIAFIKSFNIDVYLHGHISVFKNYSFISEYIDGLILEIKYINEELYPNYISIYRSFVHNEIALYIYTEINNNNLNTNFYPFISKCIANKWILSFSDNIIGHDKYNFLKKYENKNINILKLPKNQNFEEINLDLFSN